MNVPCRTLGTGKCAGVALGLLLLAISAAAQTRTFTVKNNCSETVWAAAAGTPIPVFNGSSSGGIALAPGASATTTVPTPWSSGRIWGRRECTFNSSGVGSCATGDCGGVLNCTHAGAGNTTITEWTLTGTTTGADNYDISLVDAFDFPVSIQLDDPNPSHCINTACQVDLRNFCTGDLQNKDSAGNVIGCKSLCGKYQTPNYCCAGLYGAPGSCNDVPWNTNFRGTVVKKYCNSVYGYAYDDPSSDFNCSPPPTSGYTITFCPGPSVPNSDPTVTPTYTITATNDGQTVKPGSSVTYNLNVTAGNTFTGTVKLSIAHLPQSCTWSGGKSTCTSAASSATFSTTSVSLTPNAVVPVTLTINTSATTPPILQTSNIEVMGQSGALQNVWEGQITVADPAAPDYTLQVSPNTPQTIQPGGSITYDLTLTPVNNFSGTVTLASFVTVPGTATFNPATVTLSGSTAQTATLTIATSSSAAKKNYYPLITAYSGNRLHDFQATLTVGTAATCTAAPSTAGPTAMAVSSSQINLSWTASTAPAGCTVTYTIFRSTTNGFTPSSSNQIASGVSGTSFSDTGLAASTTYYYLMKACDSFGCSGAQVQTQATTGPACSAAPSAPTGLAVTAVSATQNNLSWTASTVLSGCTLSGYSVFRSTTSGFTPSSSNQIASGVASTSYSDTNASCAVTYFYVVEATDSFGSSGPSNQASVTTGGAGGTSCGGPQINSGGPAVSPFVADKDFVGGTTINHANTIDLSGVTNPAPMAVYQTARVGSFTYTIPGFTAGSSHTVRLHFAETYFSAAGSRTFNVSINGTQVLAAFDIYKTAGAKNKAVIEQFTEAANSSGQYVIQFTSVVNQSLVSGVETQ